jgi:hypothetical protein
VSTVIKVGAAFISVFEEVVSPAQDFLDIGDEVFLVSCEVGKSVRDIFK